MTVASRTPWAGLVKFLPEATRPPCWERGTSTLTASGTPVEASVSAAPADGRLDLRVVVDPGAGRPTGARVAAGLAAARTVGQLLDRPGRAVADHLAAALTRCTWEEPVPWAVWVGTATTAGRPFAAKVYTHLTERSALERLACEGGAATVALGRVLGSLPADLPADWRFAGWDLAGDGSVAAKVYLTARPGQEHAVLSWVARPLDVDTGAVLDALSRCGLSRALWSGGMILAAGWSEHGWRLGVHAAPPADQPARWRLARALGAGVDGWDAALDDLAASEGAGLHVSWFGLTFVPPGDVTRRAVYLAPC